MGELKNAHYKMLAAKKKNESHLYMCVWKDVCPLSIQWKKAGCGTVFDLLSFL